MLSLDPTDIRILGVLQRDGRLSNQALADAVGLSPSPCWRRVKRLEAEGLIQAFVGLLSREKLGLRIIAYGHISLENHHPETVTAFDTLMENCDEVLECCSLSGQYDYLIKIVTQGMDEYESFLTKKLLRLPGVQTVNTSFVLKQKKYTTALPLPGPNG